MLGFQKHRERAVFNGGNDFVCRVVNLCGTLGDQRSTCCEIQCWRHFNETGALLLTSCQMNVARSLRATQLQRCMFWWAVVLKWSVPQHTPSELHLVVSHH